MREAAGLGAPIRSQFNGDGGGMIVAPRCPWRMLPSAGSRMQFTLHNCTSQLRSQCTLGVSPKMRILSEGRMGAFSGSPNWTLINDFTINEDTMLSGKRPFMRTCVPKALELNVTRLETVRLVEWPDSEGVKPCAYEDRSYIKFSCALRDRIMFLACRAVNWRRFARLPERQSSQSPPAKSAARIMPTT